ncbi:hypothetical protein A2955_02390 [Candidatus Woesebacteria bacterium RIFCSPLOWO2_01_FULL_37_19]|uniref:Glycosyl transferase family 1 domain-containing protein n=2 Tax=Candidatus Woeseibacteriota TaxID=1752722 RepID=A0A1F8AXW7_9BACT|nr:MAG: hypothetical protein A2771_00960 [Candidatus Woesebacteria bacterium RIFCSPHIGHO2_01_FULL_38_26b]OGM56581.1 MAG: hypothetical protein A2955_02390 [Candidatus Woesebacteria bacterium RIFCSPLOWO2_01_FULL_37_19]
MKIAFLNGYQNRRGAETFVNELSKRLKEKHRVDLMLGDKTVPKRWPLLWRAFLDPHGIYTFLFTLKYIPKMWKVKFDVVIPINGGWQPALVRLVTWLYGGKMVISGQSGIGWDDRNNLWCFPDCFVALSTYAKSWARKVNPFVKGEYIPNGVDLQKFNPKGEKLKLNLKRPIILTVAALTPSKRVDLVIRAVSKWKKVSLLLVGDGEMKDELESLGKKLLGNRFQLIKLSFEEMPKVYRSVDLFTIVSEAYYSFEIVIAEAMATNIPVVVNDDPIRREIVGDAGTLVNPVNESKYAEVMNDALKIKWGNKPRSQAEKFSWDKISESYEELFNGLVKR